MMKAFYTLTLTLVVLQGAPATAQEGAGIALPVQGKVALWDMRSDPPAALTGDLPDGVVAGACYDLSGSQMTPQQPATACLDYYTFAQSLDGMEEFSATGRIAFNDIAPDYAFRGLELRGVEGIVDCGERDSCDTVYIAGFADAQITAQAVAAARADQTVTLIGRKFWNAESIDMIVEQIKPAE